MFKLLVVLCLGAFVHGIASFRLKNVNYSFGAEWGKATVDFDGLRLSLSDASVVDGRVLQINFQHHPYKGIYYEYNESLELIPMFTRYADDNRLLLDVWRRPKFFAAISQRLISLERVPSRSWRESILYYCYSWCWWSPEDGPDRPNPLPGSHWDLSNSFLSDDQSEAETAPLFIDNDGGEYTAEDAFNDDPDNDVGPFSWDEESLPQVNDSLNSDD